MTSDEEAIREVHRAWGAASRARDLDRILDLVTDDCVFLMPGSEAIVGKDQVRAVYERMFARWGHATIEQVSRIEEIVVAVDWAFWYGTDAVTVRSKDSPPIHASGYGMGLLRREHGVWKFARGINNMTPQKA